MDYSVIDPEGRDYSPWEKRKRVVPLRTYSGKVTYSRPKHYFSARDVMRVMRSTSLDDSNTDLIENILEAIITFIEKVLTIFNQLNPWDPENKLPKTLGRIIRAFIWASWESWPPSLVQDLIIDLASKQSRFDVKIEWRKF